MADEARNSEFDRFILATGESDKIDAKGPLSWDSGCESARLSRDIASFANYRDGGVIVVGKSEGSNGGFLLDGLSDEQAATFETTKVATWINNRFSPPLSVVCHHHEFEEKRFVVITIDEFSDIPHLCTKTFDDPTSKNKHLLKENSIYVRTANAESAMIGSVADLRALIGLATAKRGHEMLTMFNAMLSGNPLLPSKNAAEQFEVEFANIKEDCGSSFKELEQLGAWMLVIRPARFNEDLFEEDVETLEERVRRNRVRLRSEFPPTQTGPHMRDWGLCNDAYGEIWGLAPSGQFFLLRPYYENECEFQCAWRDVRGQRTEPQLPPGKWLDIKPSLLTIAEFFSFGERFVGEYGVGERIHFEIRATGVNGRHLVTTDGNINRDMTPPCRANCYTFTKEVTVEEFRAAWEELAAQAMKRFSGIFPDTATSIETMRDWVQRFKRRRF